MSALVKPLTWILGLVLLVVGILGFFGTPILGLFEVNTLHNIIHLASGAIALVAVSMGYSAARTYLVVFGIVYLAVAILGFLGVELLTSLVTTNGADNVLHLAIGGVCILAGLSARRA